MFLKNHLSVVRFIGVMLTSLFSRDLNDKFCKSVITRYFESNWPFRCNQLRPLKRRPSVALGTDVGKVSTVL